MDLKKKKLRKKGMSELESFVFKELSKTGLKWTFQSVWRWRVFDFWCDEIGCAIEIDNSDSTIEDDLSDFKRSAIVVLRVYSDSLNMEKLKLDISILDKWMDRRNKYGLLTKAQSLKYFKS